MIYLTGAYSGEWVAATVARSKGRLGCLITPEAGVRVRTMGLYPVWAADNGCFTRGDRFDLGRYLAWLDALAPAQGNCLFATAPDVVGDAAATLARSLPVLPEMRRRGYRAALVGQDGLEQLPVPWEEFDAFFVGGSTAWKLSEAAYALVREAKRRGKWAHMGRVNSRRRLLAAAISGYDSADGTYVRYNPTECSSRLIDWLGELDRQGRLPLDAA